MSRLRLSMRSKHPPEPSAELLLLLSTASSGRCGQERPFLISAKRRMVSNMAAEGSVAGGCAGRTFRTNRARFTARHSRD
jgi:hypothetical protein